MAKKAEIKKLKIKTGKKTIELDFDDAKELFNALKEIFDKEVITIPQPYPIPINPCKPYWDYPEVTYTCDNGTAEVGYDNDTITFDLNQK